MCQWQYYGGYAWSVKVYLDFVYVAPAPIFPSLERLHNRMLGVVKMFSGVFVLGRVAAANVTTFHTKPKVDPRITGFEAFLAALWRARLYVLEFHRDGYRQSSSYSPTFD